jgi:hypothetical protein
MGIMRRHRAAETWANQAETPILADRHMNAIPLCLGHAGHRAIAMDAVIVDDEPDRVVGQSGFECGTAVPSAKMRRHALRAGGLW